MLVFQLQPDAVYETVSDLRERNTSDDQENIHYASVVFKLSHTQEGFQSSRLPPDTTKEEEVQYSAVNLSRCTAAHQWANHYHHTNMSTLLIDWVQKKKPLTDEAAEDSSQLYSMVQKIPRKT